MRERGAARARTGRAATNSPRNPCCSAAGLGQRDRSGGFGFGQENPTVQDDRVHGELNGRAEDNRDGAAKFRAQGVDGEATEGIATAAQALVLGRLVLGRLPGSVLMTVLMMRGRDRLLRSRQV
jgi:hypothetical protein